MKVCIVHESQHGNGQRLAEALQQSFESHGADVTLSHIDEMTPPRLVSVEPDLLIVGAAIRKFMISGKVKRWLRTQQGARSTDARQIPHGAAFVTHGLPVDKARPWAERFLRRLSRSKLVAAVHPRWISGRVIAVEGPLADGVLETVEQHVTDMLGPRSHPA